ncbi:MAG: stress response translation initiation inhibitor YciH [Candidatus Micrarchaeota archaeon]|nr:stress response translation initiation inhibitor YciH [Candidatus Micrarchaeota archaeon]
MSEMCPKCGLPKDICVCSVLDRETEGKVKIFTRPAKFKKLVTVVSGVNHDEIERTAKNLKKILACGGTNKGEEIELQGNHKEATKKALLSMGYKESNIDVL